MNTARPARPALPTREDEARSAYLRVRYSILRDNFRDELHDFVRDVFGEDEANDLGVPDTALNPLGAQTRQLSTPGLYGREPKTSGDADLLALLSEQGWWGRLQAINYLAVGSGVYGMRLHAAGTGDSTRIAPRLAHPHDLYVETDPDDPLTARLLLELRLRWVPSLGGGGRWVYAYDAFDLRNPDDPRAFVVRAPASGMPDFGDPDVYLDVLRDGDGNPAGPGGLYGDLWPDHWRYEDGAPFLPYEFWRASPVLEFFPDHRRALHQGTLRACLNWTHAARAAWAATGEHVLVGGADHDAISLDVKRGDRNYDHEARGTHSIRVRPQTLTFVPTESGQTLVAHKLGGGAQLKALDEHANLYGMLLGSVDGISHTDATRKAANPTSGAALAISAEDRRAHALQVAPLFRTSDTSAIRKWSRILGAAMGRTFGGRATISYHTVPLTPSEQEDLRADVEWKIENGQLSPLDGFLAFNPGHTRADAFEAIVEAEVDKARIAAEVARRLAAEGLGDDEDLETEDDADPEAAPGNDPEADPGNDPETPSPVDPDPDPDPAE